MDERIRRCPKCAFEFYTADRAFYTQRCKKCNHYHDDKHFRPEPDYVTDKQIRDHQASAVRAAMRFHEIQAANAENDSDRTKPTTKGMNRRERRQARFKNKETA